jgi:hypothetical protein
MQATEREERFLLACYEDGGGQGFDWRAAGERMAIPQPEADALARHLADRGVFHGLSAAGEGVFTAEGRALATQVQKEKGKDPRYWTTEQRALLKAAYTAAGTGNPPFNAGAAATAAGLSRQAADGVRGQLVQRGLMVDSRQMRTFTPAGLEAVRAHFASGK